MKYWKVYDYSEGCLVGVYSSKAKANSAWNRYDKDTDGEAGYGTTIECKELKEGKHLKYDLDVDQY